MNSNLKIMKKNKAYLMVAVAALLAIVTAFIFEQIK